MNSWSVDDLMTRAVVSVERSASYRDVVDLLVANRFSAVPVVDAGHRVIGVVSEADLLRKIEYAGDETPRLFDGRRRRGDRGKAWARTASDLMSAPAVVVPAGTSIAAAARIMDNESVKRLPVVDDLGRLIGIVSRGDLLKVHLRPDDEILQDVRSTVLRPFLVDKSPLVRATVTDGVVTLSGRVDRWSAADFMPRLARRVPGVVDVNSTLDYDVDDRRTPSPGMIIGVA